MATLLQFDFPMAGPWGDEMAEAFGDLAGIIGRSPGLRWKIWTENPEEGLGGGIYLFEDDASALAYIGGANGATRGIRDHGRPCEALPRQRAADGDHRRPRLTCRARPSSAG